MTALRPLALLAITLAASLSAPSNAQLRSLPAEARIGQIRQLTEMTVVFDRTELRLAPGIQIRDRENRIVLPGALPAGTPVVYVLDGDGLVRRAWIPTADEVTLVPPPAQPPFVPVN